jgi:hypothetical protein
MTTDQKACTFLPFTLVGSSNNTWVATPSPEVIKKAKANLLTLPSQAVLKKKKKKKRYC